MALRSIIQNKKGFWKYFLKNTKRLFLECQYVYWTLLDISAVITSLHLPSI